MKKLISLCGLMLCLLALGCAAADSKQNFSGNWVVDIAASQPINSHLQESKSYQDIMAMVVMTIDLDKMEIRITNPKHGDRVVPFTIASEAPEQLMLKVNHEGEPMALQLVLKGGKLFFNVVGAEDGRENFVFVRAK